ncbi:MAG: FadR/GntR family transcriptional regulator [Alphaproteobacteria bacterium]|nr:FadR/GntR family transcriptional regulator [Alphaproteobacteria bacterium]
MTFQTFQRPAHLSVEVARAIQREIQGGRFKDGERLPTEANLSEHFGVSRGVIREAIVRLKSEGLIETRQGSGAFVLSADGPQAFRIDAGMLVQSRELAPVFELRIELEASAAALAARRRTKRHLTRMRHVLAEIGEMIERGDWGLDPDYGFHIEIAEAAGNAYLLDLLDYVTRRITYSIALRRRSTPPTRTVLRRVHKEHEQVLAAIADQDPERASREIRSHLEGAADRLRLRFR